MKVTMIVAALAVLGMAGCVVTEATLPETLQSQQEIPVTVRMDSFINYGDSMKGAPTLCVSAPADWELQATDYIGMDKDGLVEGQPVTRTAASLTFKPPEGYVITCWQGKKSTYTLTSHGKVRLLVKPGGAGPADITFISGYDGNMNYWEHAVAVEVEAGEVVQ